MCISHLFFVKQNFSYCKISYYSKSPYKTTIKQHLVFTTWTFQEQCTQVWQKKRLIQKRYRCVSINTKYLHNLCIRLDSKWNCGKFRRMQKRKWSQQQSGSWQLIQDKRTHMYAEKCKMKWQPIWLHKLTCWGSRCCKLLWRWHFDVGDNVAHTY